MAGFNILTVTQITSYLKSYIDENKKLSGIYIKGEITDFKATFAKADLADGKTFKRGKKSFKKVIAK